MNHVEPDLGLIDVGLKICQLNLFLNLDQIYLIKRMTCKIEPIVLNGHNYAIWAPDMETLLKIKGVWKYTKATIPDLLNDWAKFLIDEKKNEVVGIIMTYISRDINFHTSRIDYPHVVWSKLNSFFYKVKEIQVMQIEKDFISL